MHQDINKIIPLHSWYPRKRILSVSMSLFIVCGSKQRQLTPSFNYTLYLPINRHRADWARPDRLVNIDDNIVYIVHVRIKSKAQTFGIPVERSFQTNNLSRNLVTKRSFNEFCLARNNILCVSPSVWIACSNKLQSLKTPSNGLSTNPSVYHHLLNHAQCLSSVGLIKEQNCVDVLVLIFMSHFFRLPNFLFNVFVCGAAMHLVMEENC